MNIFVDQLLIKFLDDTFVEDLIVNQLGPTTLFNLTYNAQDIDLKKITFAGAEKRQFQMPTFESIRTSGTEERIMPTHEQVKLNYEQSRYGRLAWIEVFLEAILSTKVHDKGAPIEKIKTKNLVEKLGGVSSLTELRTKLETFYPKSIIDAFFKEVKISSIEGFKQRGNLFLEFIHKTPPPYNPNDPQNIRKFKINICVKLQPDLKIANTLQTAKLCRSILENERNFAKEFKGGEIKTPYIFVIIFPENAVSNNVIPGLTASQIKASVKNIFENESMLAHFYT